MIAHPVRSKRLLNRAQERFANLGSKVYVALCEDLMIELLEPTHNRGWFARQIARLSSVQVLTIDAMADFPAHRGD